ncbi:MAG: hypothetical protein ACMZ64_08530 [Oleiphilus sp.]
MRILRVCLLSFTALIATPLCSADEDTIHVIMNEASGLSDLGKKHVMSLFLGRARNFPNGMLAKPFDHQTGSSIRAQFFESLTGKQISDIDAYWARLSYSGRAFPPKSLAGLEIVLQEVSANKQAISYVKGVSKERLSEQGIVVVYTLEGN